MVPYNNSNTSLNRDDNVGFNPRIRRQSANYDMSPTGVPVCQSPHNMEGPISFVAPELAEETLMEVNIKAYYTFYLIVMETNAYNYI